MKLQVFLALLMAGLSVFLLTGLVIDFWERRMAERRLRSEGPRPTASTSLIDSLLKPVFSTYAHLFKRFKWEKRRKELDQHFAEAGIDSYTHEQFWAFQVLAPLLFLGLIYALIFELRLLDIHYSVSWWFFILVVAGGIYFPVLWLNSLIKQRRASIILEFPSFVDKLTLSVEAGLDFMAAIIRITQKSQESPLKEELNRMISEIQIGSTRAQALRHMSQRIGLRDISTFSATLIQADQLGTSIGQVLRSQADRLRRERFESAERKGAIAAQKILFPLVFFIMPAVFIVVFGPLLVKLLTGGLDNLGL